MASGHFLEVFVEGENLFSVNDLGKIEVGKIKFLFFHPFVKHQFQPLNLRPGSAKTGLYE